MSIETGEGILKVKRMGLMVRILKRVRKLCDEECDRSAETVAVSNTVLSHLVT